MKWKEKKMEENFKCSEPEKDLRGEKRNFLESKELDGDDDKDAVAPTPWKIAAIEFCTREKKWESKNEI